MQKVLWYNPNGGLPLKDTTIGLPNEYIDFRSDGKEYACFWNGIEYRYDTLNYNVNGNVLHTSRGNSSGNSDIQTLTSTNLTIHTTTMDSFGSTDLWFFYSK